PDDESAAPLRAARADLLHGRPFEGEDSPGMLEQGMPGFGEAQLARASAGAFQQRQADLRLELAHRPGHGGLAHMEFSCRPREAALARDLEEGAQQVQVEAGIRRRHKAIRYYYENDVLDSCTGLPQSCGPIPFRRELPVPLRTVAARARQAARAVARRVGLDAARRPGVSLRRAAVGG